MFSARTGIFPLWRDHREAGDFPLFAMTQGNGRLPALIEVLRKPGDSAWLEANRSCVVNISSVKILLFFGTGSGFLETKKPRNISEVF